MYPSRVAAHGGGMFLLMYAISLVLFGYPIALAELSLGRRTGKGLGKAFQKSGHPQWRYLGALSALIVFCVYVFYTIMTGWTLAYIVKMVTGGAQQDSFEAYETLFNEFTALEGWNAFYTFLVVALVGTINAMGITKGIERLCKVLSPLFLLMLIGMIAYTLFLDGAMDGVRYYIVPDFSKCSLMLIFDAAAMAFLSLGVGTGILITYGSYVDKKEDLPDSSMIVSFSTGLVSFLAGLLIFAFLFHAVPSATERDHYLDQNESMNLIFIVIPRIIQKFGRMASIIGVIFFSMLLFAAITSCISLLESVSKYVGGVFGLDRRKAILATSVASYLLSVVAIKRHDFFAFLSNSTSLMLNVSAMLFAIFVAWVWKPDKVLLENKLKKESYFGRYIYFFLLYVEPLALVVLLLLSMLWAWRG